MEDWLEVASCCVIYWDCILGMQLQWAGWQKPSWKTKCALSSSAVIIHPDVSSSSSSLKWQLNFLGGKGRQAAGCGKIPQRGAETVAAASFGMNNTLSHASGFVTWSFLPLLHKQLSFSVFTLSISLVDDGGFGSAANTFPWHIFHFYRLSTPCWSRSNMSRFHLCSPSLAL